jgi:gluconokinase
MGVAGVGKTTIGTELARRLGYNFVDADQYHSAENIKKMAAGIPLTDADRDPWLIKLNSVLREFVTNDSPVVMASSALKQKYRDIIGGDLNPTWIYLKAPAAEIHERLVERHGHYATASLLQSQLETLEEPTEAITADASGSPDEIVRYILTQLGTR